MSGWPPRSDRGSVAGMTACSNPYRGFRYPAEVIEHAVWLYHCFSLSLRDVETILAARGIVVRYESIREWGLRFGRLFANALKQRRPRLGDKWFWMRCSSAFGASCIISGVRSIKMRIPMHSAHPYRFQIAHCSNLKPPTVLTMPPTLFR